MALINRYSATLQGSVIMTGNTMGLAAGPALNVNIASYPVASVTPPGGTTTTNFVNNSSYCQLQVPATGTIKYAELNWGGSDVIPGTSVNSNLPIKLTDPNNATTTINRNPATTQSVSSGAFTFYNQSVDVTSLVQAGGNGFYKIAQVPGLLGSAHLGYILIVVYEDLNESSKNINVWSANDFAPPVVTLNITGFATPSTGAVNGRLIIGANGGQPWATSESVRFGPNTASAVTLSGPNNLPNNFFASQINNNLGLLDTSGTFGTRNSTPGLNPTAGDRYNYDITNVDASPGLTNNQTAAVLIFGGGGDVVILNAVALQIAANAANISPIKQVDKTTALPNEQLLYTMVLKNTGVLDAFNTVVVDTLPVGTSFVAGSLKVNGTTVAGSPVPPGGYNVGTIPSTTTTTLTFQALVTTIPGAPTPLINSYSLAYSFSPTTQPQTQRFQSNTVTTTVPAPVLIDIRKAVNKAYAGIGDYIAYTITIPNTGGITADNIIFRDTIPLGTQFVSNSFILNNVSIPSVDIEGGVNIGSIPSGKISTINYQVQVVTLPTVNPIPNSGRVYYDSYNVVPVVEISNTVNTQVNHANLQMAKSSNKNYAKVGDTITYIIQINNTGNVSATNVIFTDTIPNDTTFVNGTIRVNGTTIPGSPSFPGVNIGTIAVGISTVNFDVVVNTMPSPNPILNTATTTFNYIINPSIPTTGSGSSNSNTHQVQVNNVRLSCNKLVDKNYAICGESIKYTFQITNIGNVSAANVVFKDTIPNGTVFVNNSVTLDGVTIPSVNPQTGVSVGTISAGATSTVTFEVVVTC